jgi:hypothetical protein
VLRLLVLIAADDNADGNIVVGKLLNGKSLLAICEFFQLNAQKVGEQQITKYDNDKMFTKYD